MDQVPRISIPGPFGTQLDAAATKIQTVYKSYRTRRNFADCALLVEHFWWKALDTEALKKRSKQEAAVSRWSRARIRLDVGDGKELNLESCKRADLQRQCIKYLGPKEREAYEVVVDDGKLIYRQSGMLLKITEGPKWIVLLFLQ